MAQDSTINPGGTKALSSSNSHQGMNQELSTSLKSNPAVIQLSNNLKKDLECLKFPMRTDKKIIDTKSLKLAQN